MNELTESWLNCLDQEQTPWLEQHGAQLDLAFLEYLKQYSDEQLRISPQLADKLTQGMLRIATVLPHEPLAYPLACWARGNWAAYHDPKQAIEFYQQALIGYRPTKNVQFIVRLLSNLAIALAEIDPLLAFDPYAEIERWQEQLLGEEKKFLIGIWQNYGIVLRRMGRYPEALIAHEQAIELAKQFKQFDRVAEIGGNLALTLGSMGQFSACEALLRESCQTAATYQHQLTVARMNMNLGELFTILGQPADALQRLQLARTQFMALGNKMELSSVLLREAVLFERIGSLAQAKRSYAQAQAQFAELQMWPQVWQALFQGAVVKRLYGEYTEAATALVEAQALCDQLQHTIWQSEVALEKVALLLANQELAAASAQLTAEFGSPPDQSALAGLWASYALLRAEICAKLWEQTGDITEFQTAQQLYEQVLDYSTRQGNRSLKRKALAALGRLLCDKQPRQGQQHLEEAAHQDDLIRAMLSIQELKASYLSQNNDILPLLMTLAIEQGEVEQALRYAWRAKGTALLELHHLIQLAHQETAHEQRALEDEVLAVRNELATLRWRKSVTTDANLPYRTFEHSDPAIRQQEERLLELRRQLNQQTSTDPLAVINAAIHLLPQMDADLLIEYIYHEQQLFAICADRHGNYTAQIVADRDTLDDLIDELNLAFRSILVLSGERRQQACQSSIDECNTLLAVGYRLLIEPLSLLPAKGKLLIAPCDQLHKLPFAALWNGRDYLTEEYIIELTPTGALLATPMPATTSQHNLILAASADGKLPALIDEAKSIQLTLPTATCLIDDPNTLAYLTTMQIPPHLLHISAHTIEAGKDSIFSALQLPNGMLTIEQCYELPLRGTELVTLSSCTTSMGMDSAGSLLAFQSAMFVAGARHVLSTLWEIDSNVTHLWLQEFYQQFAQGLTPAEALHNTQITFLTQAYLCHPVFWAAFTGSCR